MTSLAAPASAASYASAVWALAGRELVRFVRQPNRIVGALATPIVFWLLIGAGMGSSFRASGLPDGEHYLRFFFPGTVLMMLLFTAIFSTISIIEDRREGFLQSVLVAPVPRSAIAMGKVLGAAILATAQAVLMLALGYAIGIRPSPAGLALAVGFCFLLAVALASLGVCIAWQMTSTQGFHAIMNLFLMPLWFLSGSLFPAEGAWGPMGWAIRLNPLSYGLAGLRRSLYLGTAQPTDALPSPAVCLGVTMLFTAAMVAVAASSVRYGRRAELL